MSSKVMTSVLIVSIIINGLFAIHYIQDRKEKRYGSMDAVDRISFQLNEAAEMLRGIDTDDPEYATHVVHALGYVAQSEGWIEAYASSMPRNLVSWIGGMHVGLSNNAHDDVDEEEFEKTAKAIISFNDGYKKELEAVHWDGDSETALEKMEDVLSSKKYMGDEYIRK